MNIQTHRWGESVSADRIWAEVSGYGPSIADRRPLMVLQAFIDESEDDSGTFVLGGYIADAESWAGFSREWEKLLPNWGLKKPSGEWHFKMSEMALEGFLESQGGIERIQAFYRIIEKHVLASISLKINKNDLIGVQNSIVIPNKKID